MSLRSASPNLPRLAGPSDTTLSADPFEHLLCDDDEPTRVFARKEFFGERIPGGYPADEPLPGKVAVAAGSLDPTVGR